MQTILKVMCDGRSRFQMIEDYLTAFYSRFEDQAIDEIATPGSDDVAFAMDDSPTAQEGSVQELDRTLGSFRPSLHVGNEKLQFIFVSPVIVFYRPNGQRLRLLLGTPSLGTTQRTEFE